MEIVNKQAEAYAEKYSSSESELLAKIHKETYAQHAQPHMLSGHLQGRVLSLISHLKQPQYILEIGTFTGYSALCLAEGLAEDGELHTIEIRKDDAKLAKSHFAQSKYKDKIHVHNGEALQIISTLPYKWDLVFIDADKINYIAYYKEIIHRIATNGIIVADNVLYHGEVLKNPIKGKNAKAIDDFNNYISQDSDCERVMLTVRDGLLIIRKK